MFAAMFILILIFLLFVLYLLVLIGIKKTSSFEIKSIDEIKKQNLPDYFDIDKILKTKKEIFIEDENKIINIIDEVNGVDVINDNAIEYPLIGNEKNKIITSGESIYYKNLLKDERWIALRNQKIKENSYVCQNCFNIRLLHSINELKIILPNLSDKLFNVVANTLDNIQNYCFDDSYSIQISKMNFIPKYHILLCSVFIDYTRCSDNLLYLSISDVPQKILGVKFVINSENSTDELKYTNIQYTEDEKADNIDLFYIKGNSTNGNLYIHYHVLCMNKYKYQIGVLTKDEYAIAFPINGIIKSEEQLEVHHLKYSKTGNPWDVSPENLITLCHSCHIEANKQPISIE